MRIRSCVALGLALLTNAPLCSAADWRPIQGTFAVTAKNYLDPAETERRDSHYRIQLTGRSARELFLAMKVPQSKDRCTGAAEKRVGEMQCLYYKSQNRYECSFSIDVMRQKVEHGVSC